MPKTFYTERDIEDMVRQGIHYLVLTDDVVITDLARETARKLGLDLRAEVDQPPSAPVRAYIAKPIAVTSDTPASKTIKAPVSPQSVAERVEEAVVQRVGPSVDRKLLKTIIARVLDSVGGS
ncbi:MAG: hypothetical protein JXA19_02895 [Anaerolineales bacterium]|nr:hypothetical protein [Anaerolineales bacterium]